MITSSSNAHTANRSLDLDNRVSLIVQIARASLTTGTEIGVMAHSTLKAVTLDIRSLVLAEWPIAVDASMGLLASHDWVGNSIVNRNEAVILVDIVRGLDAGIAVVPVWTVEAFVADTVDVLVTSIADGLVTDITACLEHLLALPSHADREDIISWRESVLWVVTMLVVDVALNAEIVVGAVLAGNEGVFLGLDEATIAGTDPFLGWLDILLDLDKWLLFLWDKGGFGVVGWDLSWWELLSRAANNSSLLNITLDHPMIIASTKNSSVDTFWAKIVITIIAGAAMIMLIRNWCLAGVAVDGIDVLHWLSGRH